jgi:hypothetical protein
MTQLKTQRTDDSVEAYLNGLDDSRKRQDCFVLLQIMREITGEEPAMWGSSIVGFGSYKYRYNSGRRGEWFITGFAPRKRDLTVYIVPGFDAYQPLMKRLGKHKTGVSCLYLSKLEAVDLPTLRELISHSVADMRENNPYQHVLYQDLKDSPE